MKSKEKFMRTRRFHRFLVVRIACRLSALDCASSQRQLTTATREDDIKIEHFGSPEYCRNLLTYIVQILLLGKDTDNHPWFNVLSKEFLLCVEENGEIVLSGLSKRVFDNEDVERVEQRMRMVTFLSQAIPNLLRQRQREATGKESGLFAQQGEKVSCTSHSSREHDFIVS
jgi:hypothetical protein